MNGHHEQPSAPSWAALPGVDAEAWLQPPYLALVSNILGVWTAHVASQWLPGQPMQSRVFGSSEAAKAWAEWEIAQLMDRHGAGDKINVSVDVSWGTAVVVEIADGSNRWAPSFKDLFRILQALAESERTKYHYLADPLDMPRRFFQRCLDEGVTWEQLRQEFKLPDR